ncbi:abc transporter [Lucifera butyrica]|uniref:Abc transporter n=1 Tax=Lucifera butyrica TaxID=1351585 RepID=A0A498RCA0_9FIRM|nr:ABC transporter ATP-binding protein [Lucifera butyrica]VBB06778.1 abc transporter [Lucifera butyrica]
MLELRNIQFAYHPSTPVLRNISLTVTQGEFLAVIGRNGSGKTTLTRLIMALKKPTGGEILLHGRPAGHLTPADMARHIGYVFQNPDRQIFRDTVALEASYGPEQLGYSPQQTEALTREALAAVGLSSLTGAYPPSLSRGQKQRLAIASALTMKPAMLILDEPTSGQDARERERLAVLLTTLHQAGLTILLITHDMDLLAACAQRAIVMSQGEKVFDGPAASLFQDMDQLKKWGLTEPAVLSISRQLVPRGVTPTFSLEELTNSLINRLGRNRHAESSTTY